MSAVCRRAAENDRRAMKELWMHAFPEDSAQDIDGFFDTFPPAEYAFVLCESDIVCSMLFLLDITLVDGKAKYPAGYIYAGATHPKSRGKGYYKRLLSYVREHAVETGMVALVLRPASQALADSYRRIGFSFEMFGTERFLKNEELSSSEPLCASMYRTMRQQTFGDRSLAYVDWGEHIECYALGWCETRRADDGSLLWLSRDSGMVWEQLPPSTDRAVTAALWMPLQETALTAKPIWFGYGLM